MMNAHDLRGRSEVGNYSRNASLGSVRIPDSLVQRAPFRRILIIDDEPLLGQTLTIAYRDRYEIRLALRGLEGLELLETDANFDLILCDLSLPDLSGIEVFHEIIARWPELESHFRLMTGGVTSEKALTFLEEHKDICLYKPFKLAEIEDLLGAVPAALPAGA
jgi:DNA-binding response OmpR family regulator